MPQRLLIPFGGGAPSAHHLGKAHLGGKGANLAEMAGIGLPVPPGFTIPTTLCALYYEAGTRLPDALLACIGGGSNAMGIFYPYLGLPEVRLIGVEAAGEGVDTGRHAASLTAGVPGVLHGNRTYLLQNEDGQIIETHSVSAGLDYPGVGPEHAWLKDIGRAEYVVIKDGEALDAFHTLCRIEGIIPALESSHALAYAAKLAPTMSKDRILLVNLSGRGDKDMHTVAEKSGIIF